MLTPARRAPSTFGRYWRSTTDAVEGAATCVSVVADLVLWLSLAASDEGIGGCGAALRVALSLRTLRPMRLLLSVGSFRRTTLRFVEVLPELAGLFGALFALFCFYAQLGCLLFGGALNEHDWTGSTAGDTAGPAGPLCASSEIRTRNLLRAQPADRRLTAPTCADILNNFNDFGSALVTLFELLVVRRARVELATACSRAPLPRRLTRRISLVASS